jgi:hypothetical protein
VAASAWSLAKAPDSTEKESIYYIHPNIEYEKKSTMFLPLPGLTKTKGNKEGKF